MSMRPFEEHLKKVDKEVGRPTSRRVAELLPEIEAALAKGFSRAQIVDALKTEGIDITPAMLSTYLQRLRRGAATKTPPLAPLSPTEGETAKSVVPAYQHGAHDPRRLDEVMRHQPDMKALAKLAKKGNP